MTHPWVDWSIIVSENRRVTHAGRLAGPVRSDHVRPVPVPVRTKPPSAPPPLQNLSRARYMQID